MRQKDSLEKTHCPCCYCAVANISPSCSLLGVVILHSTCLTGWSAFWLFIQIVVQHRAKSTSGKAFYIIGASVARPPTTTILFPAKQQEGWALLLSQPFTLFFCCFTGCPLSFSLLLCLWPSVLHHLLPPPRWEPQAAYQLACSKSCSLLYQVRFVSWRLHPIEGCLWRMWVVHRLSQPTFRSFLFFHILFL